MKSWQTFNIVSTEILENEISEFINKRICKLFQRSLFSLNKQICSLPCNLYSLFL